MKKQNIRRETSSLQGKLEITCTNQNVMGYNRALMKVIQKLPTFSQSKIHFGYGNFLRDLKSNYSVLHQFKCFFEFQKMIKTFLIDNQQSLYFSLQEFQIWHFCEIFYRFKVAICLWLTFASGSAVNRNTVFLCIGHLLEKQIIYFCNLYVNMKCSCVNGKIIKLCLFR